MSVFANLFECPDAPVTRRGPSLLLGLISGKNAYSSRSEQCITIDPKLGVLDITAPLRVINLAKIVGDRASGDAHSTPSTMLLELDDVGVRDIGWKIVACQFRSRNRLGMAVVDEFE
jgi:hypothetical protein